MYPAKRKKRWEIIDKRVQIAAPNESRPLPSIFLRGHTPNSAYPNLQLSVHIKDAAWETGRSRQMTVTEGRGPATTHVGTGLPTYQELLDHYPAKFTWQQLKTFVNSGSVPLNRLRHLPLTHDFSDLGLLKRDRMLQLRYRDWGEEIKKKWGTLGVYLPAFFPFRLQHSNHSIRKRITC